MHRFNKMDSQSTGAATTSKYLWSTEIYVRVHKHVTERKKNTLTLLVENLKYSKAALLWTTGEKRVIYQIKPHHVV